MKYYLPISSLNFNSIFASESISPQSFYHKRQYGYKRNEKIDLQFMDDYIILFNNPVFFEINNSELESYPILIEIDKSIIETNIEEIGFTDIERSKVFTYPKSIYFDTKCFRFVFPNENIQQLILVKSFSSLETKTIEKYKNYFISFPQLEKDGIKVARGDIKILNNVNPNLEKDKYVYSDELYDSIKGCILSTVISSYYYKNKVQLEIDLLLKNIINIYGSLKSELEINSKKKEDIRTLIKNKIVRLNKSLNMLRKSLKTITPRDEKLIIGEYLKSHSVNNIDFIIDELKKVVDVYNKLKESSEKPYINSIYKMNDIEIYFSRLINNYRELTQREKIYLDTKITDSLYVLAKNVEKSTITSLDIEAQNKIESYVMSMKDLNILSFKSIYNLSPDELRLLEIILNILLVNRKKRNQEINLEVKNILICIGSNISEQFGQKSKERAYLLEVYNLIINKQESKLKKTSSLVLVNFLAFILNINSLEKMENYITKNKIQNFTLAFSFWGTYNGFSTLPKTFTHKFYSSADKELFESIDDNLKKLYKYLEISKAENIKFQLQN